MNISYFFSKLLRFPSKILEWLKFCFSKMREDYEGFLRACLIYVAVFGIYTFILFASGSLSKPENSLGIFLSVFLLLALASISRIRFLGNARNILEEEVSREKAMIEMLRKENAFLKEESKNRNFNFLGMDWIFEINLLEVKTKITKSFDFFIPKKGEQCHWKDKPEENKIESKSKRAIGCLTIDHTSTVGIDLKKVIFSVNEEERKVYYSIPKPQITGVKNFVSKWNIKVGLECKKSILPGKKATWVVSDEDQKELSIFSDQSDKEINLISSGDYDLDQLSLAFTVSEARRRVEGLVKSISRMEPVAFDSVPSGETITMQEFLRQSEKRELLENDKEKNSVSL